MGELNEKADVLLKWATENDLQTDPERITKLYDEAKKRWEPFLSPRRLSEIVEDTLRKME